MARDSGDVELGAGIIARYTCGCSVVRDFDGHEYQQASLLCAGGSEHGRRVVNPTREKTSTSGGQRFPSARTDEV